MPSTNLLAMPLVQMVIETGTNEDWLDSIKFVVDTGGLDPSLWPQLDLRGISFEMEVRRTAPDHQVILSASTENGSLLIGEPPDFGYLLINISIEEMKTQQPGAYVADIVGSDPEFKRRIAQIELSIVEGITR
jgi:hypothetical protein